MREITKEERIEILNMTFSYDDAVRVMNDINYLSETGEWKDRTPEWARDFAKALNTTAADSNVLSMAKDKIIACFYNATKR